MDMRARLISFAKNAQSPEAFEHLRELHRTLRVLTGTAGSVGFRSISSLSGAIEALINELIEKPKNANPSSVRTAAHALDFLGQLVQSPQLTSDVQFPAPIILVLDDEEISRRLICNGLERANLRSISLSDPTVALKVVQENRFELIFSDINMPEMRGWSFARPCANFRRTKTPPSCS